MTRFDAPLTARRCRFAIDTSQPVPYFRCMKTTASKLRRGDSCEVFTANGWTPATFRERSVDAFGGASVIVSVAGGFGRLDVRPEWVRVASC